MTTTKIVYGSRRAVEHSSEDYTTVAPPIYRYIIYNIEFRLRLPHDHMPTVLVDTVPTINFLVSHRLPHCTADYLPVRACVFDRRFNRPFGEHNMNPKSVFVLCLLQSRLEWA